MLTKAGEPYSASVVTMDFDLIIFDEHDAT
jgi:hypothetical protein